MTTAKGRLITRSITSTRPIDMTLNLDCIEDPLTDVQLMLKSKLQEDYQRVIAALDEIIKKDGGQLLTQTNAVSGYQVSLTNCGIPGISSKSNHLNINQSKPSQAIKVNVLNNSTSPQGNIQLVMDPRMGLILNTVQSQNQNSTATLTSHCQKSSIVSTHIGNENNQFTRSTRQNTIRAKVLQIQQPEIIEDISSATSDPSTSLTSSKSSSGSLSTLGTTTTQIGQTHQSIGNLKIKSTVTARQSGAHSGLMGRPTEQTSIGGIAIGNKHTADIIDESKKNLPDGKEIAFNKINGGRTFPSLVVIARPYIRAKDVPAQIATKERNELDAKVKSVLMYSATRFAEWLIQQGLVKSEQYCDQHGNNNPKPKLKLGMYSDCGTFPYSGGYVWISSCCPDRFVSVFSGSLFQGAPHTPSVLLKLIYHWSCQTNVQNVVSWVKVSNVYVKNFYTNLRSICTAAVWDKSQLIGGKGWNIQVGVISLGTTSQDGNLRKVKVEVLGILNPETGELRLRACEPVQDNDRTFKRRFNNILQPLKDWVHKDSRIITDFTVDKCTLNDLGFNQVIQVAYSNQNSRNNNSNYQIMDYLRKIVPRMFQNTLSLLSRQMIQQFLDELVWREMFGTTASRAFYSIISHIAEQTRASTSDNLLDRLARIAANPFNDWSYSNTIKNSNNSMIISSKDIINSSKDSVRSDTSLLALKSSSSSSPSSVITTRKSRKRSMVLSTSIIANTEAVKRIKADSKFESKDYDSKNDEVPLHEFYYGTLEGDKSIAGITREERRSFIYFTCFLCSTTVKSNTEVMEHMIKHVPPRVPGQSHCHVCRYCCAAFSSKHQMVTHVAEAHSTFGNSDSHMVVCGICEQKFSNTHLLVSHMSTTHLPSEMPYRCETCGYRTSSHKDAIDHFYKFHEKGEYLQCPYCLKVMHYCIDGIAISANIHAYLVHMQRHVVRREQGRGNKCSRCCLWFNQKSSLKLHQAELHIPWIGFKNTPYVSPDKSIKISKQRHQLKRIEIDNPLPELPDDGKFKKWNSPIVINVPSNTIHSFRCQECEEDIDETEHYPGEQCCSQCRYVTCCWRAFKEHQQQIHNERPMTSLIVPSPLLNIPLEKKMRCSCGYSTKDGNLLAKHYVECKKIFGSSEKSGSTGMLDSLGLVPKNIT